MEKYIKRFVSNDEKIATCINIQLLQGRNFGLLGIKTH